MIFEEKSERRDQSSFSFLENINFQKSLPRAPEFKYPPLCRRPTFLCILGGGLVRPHYSNPIKAKTDCPKGTWV